MTRPLASLPFVLAALLLLSAGVASAHPHEWYDVNVIADLGNGRDVLSLDIQLQPDPFTNAMLHQNADLNQDGTITAAEVAKLGQLYREPWGKADWFTHVLLNGDPCRPVRMRDVRLFRGPDAEGQSVFTVRLLVEVPIARHKEYNTINLMFFDVSNYTALTLSSANVELRADTRRVEITAISQSRRSEVRLLYHLLPDPPAGTPDPETGASGADGEATGSAAQPAASVVVKIEDTGDGPALTLMERFAEWARSVSHFVEGKLRQLKSGADMWLLLMLMGGVALWGFLHALGPGHGKGLIAAYLAQREARVTDVLKLGFIIAYVHTGAAVVLIGIIKLFADAITSAGGQKAFMDGAQGWVGLCCYTFVVLMGLWMLRGRIVGHDHDHDEHIESFELRKIAIAYGAVPCPAAMMLMTFALGADMFHVGMLLVAAQAFGIALVLVGVGIAVLLSRRGLTGAFRPHHPNDQPAVALAGVPVTATTTADDGFTHEHEIEWLDDDEPATQTTNADDDVTHEDQIEWLDDDDEQAAIPARLDTPSYTPAGARKPDRPSAADDSHDDHDHEELPVALRLVENILGFGGAIAMVILGAALVWYHGHWVLGIF